MRKIPRLGSFKRCSACKIYCPMKAYRLAVSSLDGRGNVCCECDKKSRARRHEQIGVSWDGLETSTWGGCDTMKTRLDEAIELVTVCTAGAATGEAISDPAWVFASLLTATLFCLWFAIRWRPLDLRAVQ